MRRSAQDDGGFVVRPSTQDEGSWECAGVELRWLVVAHAFMHGEEFPAPSGGEVFEFRVGRADECDFLFAAPALELFLAGDGGADVEVLLVIEEARAVVFLGEAFECAVFMVPDAVIEVAGYTDVERAGWAAHDVGVTGFHPMYGVRGLGFVAEKGLGLLVMVAASGSFGFAALRSG